MRLWSNVAFEQIFTNTQLSQILGKTQIFGVYGLDNPIPQGECIWTNHCTAIEGFPPQLPCERPHRTRLPPVGRQPCTRATAKTNTPPAGPASTKASAASTPSSAVIDEEKNSENKIALS